MIMFFYRFFVAVDDESSQMKQHFYGLWQK